MNKVQRKDTVSMKTFMFRSIR